ncbi:MAG: tRNA lysidine(34) synthetase TilS [Verrucomicrobiae bacterium]|nr:tRNA lysidine(34) synthetase TilS [Verrucomicrobiae bacterium]NNJ85957.1 tRNA lysidine(34) synthetase TilS [Akkermansiaceae bacterium]
MALLHLLLDAGYKKLVLCHLNHGLRGRASGQDAALVRRLAKKYELSNAIEKVDVALRMRQTGKSMELAARHARHEFFCACSNKYRCNRVLLAHHADDQVETILFNLLRGSGGLRGMLFSTEHVVSGKSVEFLRPLLNVTRKQIDAYLSEKKIRYRDDASNEEAISTRNRLRHEAIPLLTEIMSRDITPSILKAYAISTTHKLTIDEMLESSQLRDPQGRLFLPKIKKLPPSLQSAAIHHYLKECDIGDISHALLTRCVSLVSDTSTAKVNLPGGKFFRRKEKRLFVS